MHNVLVGVLICYVFIDIAMFSKQSINIICHEIFSDKCIPNVSMNCTITHKLNTIGTIHERSIYQRFDLPLEVKSILKRARFCYNINDDYNLCAIFHT